MCGYSCVCCSMRNTCSSDGAVRHMYRVWRVRPEGESSDHDVRSREFTSQLVSVRVNYEFEAMQTEYSICTLLELNTLCTLTILDFIAS